MFLIVIFLSSVVCQYAPSANPWTGMLQCQTNDFLYNMTSQVQFCLTCQPGCAECCDPNLCSKCLVEYELDTNTSTCYRCPLYCDKCSYNSNNTKICQTCSLGYYLTPNNTCIPCVNGCGVCLNSKSCNQCEDGYYSNNNNNGCGLCPYGCKTCSTKDSGSTFQCPTCITEYYQSQNSCLHCPNGCKTCTSAKSCGDCHSSFYLKNNMCVKSTESCQECNINTGQCYLCYLGYMLDTKKNRCVGCPDSFCLVCDLNNPSQCKNCTTGYDSINGKCQLCDSNCLHCTGRPNNCAVCKDTMFVTKYTGQISNTTNSTTNNQNVDSVINCQLCMSGCKHCSNTKSCNTCQDGFSLTVAKDKCVTCMTNCNLCTNTMCLQCADGYYYDGIQCTECGQACQKCIGNGYCLKCIYGYYVSQGGCVPCVDGVCSCSVYDALVKSGYNYSSLISLLSIICLFLITL